MKSYSAISVELHSSVETSWALRSCSPGSNPIYCGTPLVEKSIQFKAIFCNAFHIELPAHKFRSGFNALEMKGVVVQKKPL